MENITLGQMSNLLAIGLPILGVLFFLFKIYQKIEKSDDLTKMSLKANLVMLDHFIGKGEGNGEFKQLREEMQNVLLK
jgi:hypothetical protein